MRTGRPYMSIGEVLAVLKPEFPDASVSKIRFLETEGLIEPERTPSGYRKFYQRDLDRLRQVLTLQRDSYLPLRVIKERLAAADAGVATPESIATPAAVPAPPVPGPGAVAPPPAAPQPVEDELAAAAPVALTESDLAGASGLDLTQTKALREFGVICQHQDNGHAYFDADDLAVARIARDFLKLGIEPRHLKTLRRFAEQEAALFEQVVSPALRHRRPEARQQATETLRELMGLARQLRGAYVRQSLRSLANGDR